MVIENTSRIPLKQAQILGALPIKPIIDFPKSVNKAFNDLKNLFQNPYLKNGDVKDLANKVLKRDLVIVCIFIAVIVIIYSSAQAFGKIMTLQKKQEGNVKDFEAAYKEKTNLLDKTILSEKENNKRLVKEIEKCSESLVELRDRSETLERMFDEKAVFRLVEKNDAEEELTLENIQGINVSLEELKSFVFKIKNASEFKNMTGHLPKGFLFKIPLGLDVMPLVQSLSKEVNMPLYYSSGSSFASSSVNGERDSVDNLFKKMKQKAPCILFIDELDEVGKWKGQVDDFSKARGENILSYLLFKIAESPDDVFVVSSSSSARDLGSSFQASPCFRQQIEINNPSVEGLEFLLGKYTRGFSLADDVNFKEIAQLVKGFTVLDLKKIIWVAAELVFQKGKEQLVKADFLDAIEKVKQESLNSKESFGSPARLLADAGEVTTFDQVAGIDGSVSELKDIIRILNDPLKFKRMGGEFPKGIICAGPPGTGKTLLARAIAGESNLPFYYCSGSDIGSEYIGIGADRVRKMFLNARKAAEAHGACILFIDEIDALAPARSTSLGKGVSGGENERAAILAQLLTEMDGIGSAKGIILIGATNRITAIDQALLRSGRLDRKVIIGLPDEKGREAILKVHAGAYQLGSDLNLEELSRDSKGFSGADLKLVFKEAVILAFREQKEFVEQSDLKEALAKISNGKAKG
jgi:ATP-dependent Zn protease